MFTISNIFQSIEPSQESGISETIWRSMCLLAHLQKTGHQDMISLHTEREHQTFLHILARYHIKFTYFPQDYCLIPDPTKPPIGLSNKFMRLDSPSNWSKLEDLVEYQYGKMLHGISFVLFFSFTFHATHVA